MCSSIAMPVQDGPGSIFPHFEEASLNFNYAQKEAFCEQTEGRKPDFDFILSEFGGYNPREDFKD